MLARHRHLLEPADVIADLRLSPSQVRQAASSVLHIVHRAWARRAPELHGQSLEEFADRIPAWHWPLMFEACALGHLGRRCEARALAVAGRALRDVMAGQPSPPPARLAVAARPAAPTSSARP
ncbi:hypothetical protein [Streptomyces abikoensis]|uniref:Uncharacterized protein n=1 Tax=Streptomyces abikoensis TaxID=97398 RepID=A0ABW7T7Q9_9ACTN